MRKAGVPSLDEMERRYAGALAVAELANDDEQARKLVADLKRLYKWYGAHWGIYPDNEDEAKADVPARESDSGRDVADV